MTLTAPPTTAGPSAPASVPRLARWPVGAVAAAVAAAHLAVAWIPGWWFDEALMLAIGRHHLDWGSVDQPPTAPLIAALMDLIAPGNVLVLRLPAVAATAATVVLAAMIARELGGDTRAQTLTAIAQGTGLWLTLSGHWLTPYTLEPLTWLVIGWLLVRWWRVRDDRLLLALGVAVGVAAQTKFQVLLLAAVMLGVGRGARTAGVAAPPGARGSGPASRRRSPRPRWSGRPSTDGLSCGWDRSWPRRPPPSTRDGRGS